MNQLTTGSITTCRFLDAWMMGYPKYIYGQSHYGPLAPAVAWRLGMVVRQPPVLLLDECTSALDPTTQEAAQKTILKDFPRQGGSRPFFGIIF